MNRPNWTIVYNIDCGWYIGTGWEFYSEEDITKVRYDFLKLDPKCCPTMRPYHHKTDRAHLGAGQRILIK